MLFGLLLMCHDISAFEPHSGVSVSVLQSCECVCNCLVFSRCSAQGRTVAATEDTVAMSCVFFHSCHLGV